MLHVLDSVRSFAAQGLRQYPTAAALTLEAVLSEHSVFAPDKQSRNSSGLSFIDEYQQSLWQAKQQTQVVRPGRKNMETSPDRVKLVKRTKGENWWKRLIAN